MTPAACLHEVSRTIETRGDKRRRRECSACNHRFTTYEVTADRLQQLENYERQLLQFKRLLQELK